MRLSIGDQLGPYRILSPLGAGGMGEVYRAKDPQLDRDVAIKVLPDRLAEDSEAAERFAHEAKTLAAISHPNILTVFAFASEGGVAYAVTELLEGETFSEWLTREGAVAWRTVADIGLAVTDGLAAAHSRGITHRDIKPANLFLTSEGVGKILDFGLAKSTHVPPGSDSDELDTLPTAVRPPERTAAGVILGTVGYMSPEQAKGSPASAASDVFSLGCVLYEMLTGVPAFARATPTETLAAILREDPAGFETAIADVPRELQRIVLKALEKDPADRFPSAVELQDELSAFRQRVVDAESATVWRVLRRPRVAGPALVVLVVVATFLVLFTQRTAREHWARQEALPEVTRWIEEEQYGRALELAREVDGVIPDDPVLLGLWARMSNPVTVETDPPGADVFYRENAPEAEWRLLGQSPIDDRRLPLGGFRLRIEKEGFEPREILSALSYAQEDKTFEPLPSFSTPAERNRMSVRLDAKGSVPPGMVAVDGGRYLLPLTNFPVGDEVTLEPYFIDRTEVTNAEFKEFVVAGGYQGREYWQDEFRRDGRTVTWEEAMTQLVDSTGRPGPATWEVGNYPAGQDDYPVGGVSWYEAAAYAAFRGKSLPTVYHWARAALPSSEHVMSLSPEIVPLSNFGGDGPAPVGSYPGIGASGAADLAGNLREWAWNASGENRFSLGGAWNEPVYTFNQPAPMDPFDRSSINGFRCMKERDRETPEAQRASIDFREIDFYSLERLSDEVFAVYEGLFSYEATPLNPALESTDDTPADWKRESVSIDAAYGGERFTVHLDLPKSASPPYQAVVYFPGTNALEQSTFEDMYWERFDYVPRSGRVLVRPVLANMYERSDGNRPETRQAIVARDAKWLQDMGRTLDYLETRGDGDVSKVAYMGLSLGSRYAPIMLVYEDRFKVAVLLAGGIGPDELTSRLVPRVTVPLLLLAGRYDYLLPVETRQTPFMDLLGTPEEDKRHVIFEAGHLPLPRAKMIRETLEWLDRYQNPVVPLAQPSSNGER